MSDYDRAAAAIDEVFGTKNTEVRARSAGDAVGNITVVIADPAVPEGYEKESIQSTAALIAYRNLSGHLSSDSVAVEVSVNMSGEMYRRTYSASDLRYADRAVTVAGDMLGWDASHGISGVLALVDAEFIPDSVLMAVGKGLMSLDSSEGKAVNKLITGFRPSVLSASSEHITLVWGELQREKSLNDCLFYVRSSNGKIMLMDVK